ncbi:hypothetical protein HUJ05_005231 [Dendroctonus ponderosae]|nr:hypothetical protein HUJ05_005231 [Dendroctonus ponderosae]KAH1004416.1 hypothetical protein HUJ05_005231 [Dendroctonus ponderosae]KAH1004417.1 hypothetical protein HUJ05_005231 [Dendroctonus ponderosae]
MNFIFLICLAVALCQATGEKLRFDNHTLYRLTPKSQEMVDNLRYLEENAYVAGYTFFTGTIAENVPVDILVPPKEAETFSRFLDDADIESSILNKNIQNAIDAEGFRPEARAGTFDWTSYHTFDESVRKHIDADHRMILLEIESVQQDITPKKRNPRKGDWSQYLGQSMGSSVEGRQHLDGIKKQTRQLFLAKDFPGDGRSGDSKVQVCPDEWDWTTVKRAVSHDAIIWALSQICPFKTAGLRCRATSMHTGKEDAALHALVQNSEEISNWVRNLAFTHADRLTLINGGTTFQGREIIGVKLSTGPENNKPAVFIEANIHAREWITSAVATYILNELVVSQDPAVRRIAEAYVWYIFPVVNPDGFVHSHDNGLVTRHEPPSEYIGCVKLMRRAYLKCQSRETSVNGFRDTGVYTLTKIIFLDADLISAEIEAEKKFECRTTSDTADEEDENRLWRKTRTPYTFLCFGADPNRNWPYQWMQGGASNQACSDTYAGPNPLSETSTSSLAFFIDTVGPNLLAYISLHSFSQMLLLPYGHTTAHLDNYDEMLRIGTQAIADLSVRYGTQYVIGNIAETIYVATGGSMDYVKDKFKTPIAYTYELRDRGQNGFLLPANQIIPTSLETLDSLVSIFRSYHQLHPYNETVIG